MWLQQLTFIWAAFNHQPSPRKLWWTFHSHCIARKNRQIQYLSVLNAFLAPDLGRSHIMQRKLLDSSAGSLPHQKNTAMTAGGYSLLWVYKNDKRGHIEGLSDLCQVPTSRWVRNVQRTDFMHLLNLASFHKCHVWAVACTISPWEHLEWQQSVSKALALNTQHPTSV